MPCQGGCTTLLYRGPSPLEGRRIGQCIVCGAVHHGYTINWRITRDPTHGAVMRLRPERQREIEKSRRSPRRESPRPKVDQDLLRELAGDGTDLSRVHEYLAKMGVRVS
jgi:hypothetical protein